MELAENPNIHTVTQINNRVKSYIEQKYLNIYVDGEVASFQEYPSGHTYFILKDKISEIPCVLFKYQNKHSIQFKLGMQLIIVGNVSLYSTKGKYQFIVTYLYESGVGYAYLELKKLKNKLAKEGLFLDKYKKKIPKYPSIIGLITSINGAVVQDVIKVFKQKAPNIQLIIRNTQIQGIHSVNDIIESINEFNMLDNVDSILLCRGGGSMENFQPFNDEKVGRAIFNSVIPIITGIGHESDITISDFISDFRASTPTAAAEKSIYDLNNIMQSLDIINKKINFTINNKINLFKEKIKFIKHRGIFFSFEFKFNNYRDLLIQQKKQLLFFAINKVDFYTNNIKVIKNNLENLNPDKILDRGYGILETKDGKIISSINKINIGDAIKIKMKRFKLKVEIREIINNEKK